MHAQHLGQPASFSELWSPEIITVTLVLAALYLTFVGSEHKVFKNSSPATGMQKTLFLLGLLFFYLAVGSPINYYGHYYLFSSHMLQQSLLYLAMPPLLLLGTPEWMLQAIFKNAALRKVLYFFTNPIIAVVSFNVLFSFYHMPFIFDAAAENHWLMTIYHVVLVVSAFQMWWPVISPMPGKQPLSELQKLAYIFANGVLITPACALIIFSDSLLYTTYSQAPLIFASHSALADQRTGGILMKMLQELIYGSTLAYIFFKWYSKEKGIDIDIPHLNEIPTGKLVAAPSLPNENKG